MTESVMLLAVYKLSWASHKLLQYVNVVLNDDENEAVRLLRFSVV